MAGGIDWFRWHHGSITDPKFQLIAKKVGVRLGDVIAVWAYVLEKASAADERGTFGEIDCEAVDCLIGCDEGTTQNILAAMQTRDLVDEHGQVVAWHRRQPKREDETAAERKRRQREREHEMGMADVTGVSSRDVTQGHADVTHGHDRGEERREEKKNPNTAPTELVDLPADESAYRVPNCPYAEIVKAYAELLPMLPQVAVLSDTRKSHVAARWKAVCGDQKFTREQGIEWFRDFFATVARSAFLTGNGKPNRDSGRVWAADFDWLMLPTNFVKVVEGRYQDRRAA